MVTVPCDTFGRERNLQPADPSVTSAHPQHAAASVSDQALFELAPVTLSLTDHSALWTTFQIWRAQGVRDIVEHFLADPQRLRQCWQEVILLRVNQRALTMYGASSQAEMVARFRDTIRTDRPTDLLNWFVALWNCHADLQHLSCDTVRYTLQGKRMDVRLHATVLPDSPLPWSRVLISAEDITSKLAIEKENERLACVDHLTNLSNRRDFITKAAAELSRAQRYGAPLTVLMIDLDHFKNVNDCFGHHVGDRVLSAFADKLRHCVREVDLTGRLGGEEFAVLLPNTNADEASDVMDRLRAELASAPIANTDQHAIYLTISVGLAELAPSIVSVEAFLSKADSALYAAKRNGRDRLCIG